MKKYENYLDNHNKEIITLKQEILNKNRRIEKLEKSNNKATLDYMKIKDKYNKECYENVKLTDVLNDTKDLCNGLIKFIDKLCFEGYILQEKYEEQGTLFRNDEGKWINGRYYTKDQLDKMKKIMTTNYSHYFLFISMY